MKTLGFCQPKDEGQQTSSHLARLAVDEIEFKSSSGQKVEHKLKCLATDDRPVSETESLKYSDSFGSISGNSPPVIRPLNGLHTSSSSDSVSSANLMLKISVPATNEIQRSKSLSPLNICVPNYVAATGRKDEIHSDKHDASISPSYSSHTTLVLPSQSSKQKLLKRPPLESLIARLHHRVDDATCAPITSEYEIWRKFRTMNTLPIPENEIQYPATFSSVTANVGDEYEESMHLDATGDDNCSQKCDLSDIHYLCDSPSAETVPSSQSDMDRLVHCTSSTLSSAKGKFEFGDVYKLNCSATTAFESVQSNISNIEGSTSSFSDCSSSSKDGCHPLTMDVQEAACVEKAISTKVSVDLDKFSCKGSLSNCNAKRSLSIPILESVNYSTVSSVYQANTTDLDIPYISVKEKYNEPVVLEDTGKFCENNKNLQGYDAGDKDVTNENFSDLSDNNNIGSVDISGNCVIAIDKGSEVLECRDVNLVSDSKCDCSVPSVSKSNSNTPMFSDTPSDASQSDMIVKISDAVAALISSTSEDKLSEYVEQTYKKDVENIRSFKSVFDGTDVSCETTGSLLMTDGNVTLNTEEAGDCATTTKLFGNVDNLKPAEHESSVLSLNKNNNENTVESNERKSAQGVVVAAAREDDGDYSHFFSDPLMIPSCSYRLRRLFDNPELQVEYLPGSKGGALNKAEKKCRYLDEILCRSAELLTTSDNSSQHYSDSTDLCENYNNAYLGCNNTTRSKDELIVQSVLQISVDQNQKLHGSVSSVQNKNGFIVLENNTFSMPDNTDSLNKTANCNSVLQLANTDKNKSPIHVGQLSQKELNILNSVSDETTSFNTEKNCNYLIGHGWKLSNADLVCDKQMEHSGENSTVNLVSSNFQENIITCAIVKDSTENFVISDVCKESKTENVIAVDSSKENKPKNVTYDCVKKSSTKNLISKVKKNRTENTVAFCRTENAVACDSVLKSRHDYNVACSTFKQSRAENLVDYSEDSSLEPGNHALEGKTKNIIASGNSTEIRSEALISGDTLKNSSTECLMACTKVEEGRSGNPCGYNASETTAKNLISSDCAMSSRIENNLVCERENQVKHLVYCENESAVKICGACDNDKESLNENTEPVTVNQCSMDCSQNAVHLVIQDIINITSSPASACDMKGEIFHSNEKSTASSSVSSCVSGSIQQENVQQVVDITCTNAQCTEQNIFIDLSTQTSDDPKGMENCMSHNCNENIDNESDSGKCEDFTLNLHSHYAQPASNINSENDCNKKFYKADLKPDLPSVKSASEIASPYICTSKTEGPLALEEENSVTCDSFSDAHSFHDANTTNYFGTSYSYPHFNSLNTKYSNATFQSEILDKPQNCSGTTYYDIFSFFNFLHKNVRNVTGKCCLCKIFVNTDLKLHASKQHSCISYIPVYVTDSFQHHMKKRIDNSAITYSDELYDNPVCVCRTCGYVLKSMDSVRLHINVHPNVYMVQISSESCQCDKLPYSYSQHQWRKLLLDSRHVCSFCYYYFACEVGLLVHLKVSHFSEYSCTVCHAEIAHDNNRLIEHNDSHKTEFENLLSNLVVKEQLQDQTRVSWNALDNHINYLDGKAFTIKTLKNLQEESLDLDRGYLSLPMKVDQEFPAVPQHTLLSPGPEMVKYLKGKLTTKVIGNHLDEYTAVGFDMPIQFLLQKKFGIKRGRKPKINIGGEKSKSKSTRVTVTSALSLRRIFCSRCKSEPESAGLDKSPSATLRRSSRRRKGKTYKKFFYNEVKSLNVSGESCSQLSRTRSGMHPKDVSQNDEVEVQNDYPVQTQPVLSGVAISGEWVNYHTFVCCSCGAVFLDLAEVMDHKWEAHSGVWCAHTMIQGQDAVPDTFCRQYQPLNMIADSDIQKAMAVTKSKKFSCSKCSEIFSSQETFHSHLIECGGINSIIPAKKKNKKGFRFRRRKGQGIPHHRYANNSMVPTPTKHFHSGTSTPNKEISQYERYSSSGIKQRLEIAVGYIEDSKLKSKLQAILSRTMNPKQELTKRQRGSLKMKLRKKIQHKRSSIRQSASGAKKGDKIFKSIKSVGVAFRKHHSSYMENTILDEKVSGTAKVILHDISESNALKRNIAVADKPKNKLFNRKEVKRRTHGISSSSEADSVSELADDTFDNMNREIIGENKDTVKSTNKRVRKWFHKKKVKALMNCSSYSGDVDSIMDENLDDLSVVVNIKSPSSSFSDSQKYCKESVNMNCKVVQDCRVRNDLWKVNMIETTRKKHKTVVDRKCKSEKVPEFAFDVLQLDGHPPLQMKRKRRPVDLITLGLCDKRKSDFMSEPEAIPEFRRERIVSRMGLRSRPRQLSNSRYSLRPPAINVGKRKSSVTDNVPEISVSSQHKNDSTNFVDNKSVPSPPRKFLRYNIDNDSVGNKWHSIPQDSAVENDTTSVLQIYAMESELKMKPQKLMIENERDSKSQQSNLSGFEDGKLITDRIQKKSKSNQKRQVSTLEGNSKELNMFHGEERITQKNFKKSLRKKIKSTPNKKNAVQQLCYKTSKKLQRINLSCQNSEYGSLGVEGLLNSSSKSKRKSKVPDSLTRGILSKKKRTQIQSTKTSVNGKDVSLKEKQLEFDVSGVQACMQNDETSLGIVPKKRWKRKHSSNRKRKKPITPAFVVSDTDSSDCPNANSVNTQAVSVCQKYSENKLEVLSPNLEVLSDSSSVSDNIRKYSSEDGTRNTCAKLNRNYLKRKKNIRLSQRSCKKMRINDSSDESRAEIDIVSSGDASSQPNTSVTRKRRKKPLTPAFVPSDSDSLSDFPVAHHKVLSLSQNQNENKLQDSNTAVLHYRDGNSTSSLKLEIPETSSNLDIIGNTMGKIKSEIGNSNRRKRKYLKIRKNAKTLRKEPKKKTVKNVNSVSLHVGNVGASVNESDYSSYLNNSSKPKKSEISSIKNKLLPVRKKSKRKCTFNKKLPKESSEVFSRKAASDEVRVLSYRSLNTDDHVAPKPLKLDVKNENSFVSHDELSRSAKETLLRIKKCKTLWQINELDENSPAVRKRAICKPRNVKRNKSLRCNLSSGNRESILDEKADTFYCADCGLSFDSSLSCEDHQQDCRNIAFEMSLMAEDHLFECPYCHLTFALKGTQRQHSSSCRVKKNRKNSNRKRNHNFSRRSARLKSSSFIAKQQTEACQNSDNDIVLESLSCNNYVFDENGIAARFSLLCQENKEFCITCALLYTMKISTQHLRHLVTATVAIDSMNIMQIKNLAQLELTSVNADSNFEVFQRILRQSPCVHLPSVFESCLQEYSKQEWPLFKLETDTVSDLSNPPCIAISRPELLKALTSVEELLKETDDVQICLKKRQMLLAMKDAFQAGTDS